MPLDIQRTIDVLCDALLQKLGDEVELIFRYGSHLQGTTYHYSDLDISYVPVHEQTWTSITVLVEDTLVDLYPIHWAQLERMANFDDVRGTVLLNAQIVYQRSPEAAARFQRLTEQLGALQQPQARRAMLRKAQAIFQTTGYAYYLLRQEAEKENLLACLHQSQKITSTVLHVLAVCNQRPTDTRKLSQVLALPRLPENFANLLERVTLAHTPDELLAACEALLKVTRDFLLDEQQQLARAENSGEQPFPAVFRAAYPEFKGDLQHVLLACEQENAFLLKEKLLSVYHELMIHLTQARTGIEYNDFNSLAEYEQQLETLGFPALWPYVAAQDYAALHEQCQQFDRRLQTFLTENSVGLYSFASLDELQEHLRRNHPNE